MKDYWGKRIASSQNKITTKNIKQINEQLKRYYSRTMKSIIASFESTYDNLLNTIADGRAPTVADLYKLDKYWQLQGQLQIELERLGDKQTILLAKNFENQFFDIYKSFSIKGKEAFSTLDIAGARQMLNSIWCADGKNWSSRIWINTDRL